MWGLTCLRPAASAHVNRGSCPQLRLENAPRISVTKYRRVTAEIDVPRHTRVLRTAAMPLMGQKSFFALAVIKNNSINEKIIFRIKCNRIINTTH